VFAWTSITPYYFSSRVYFTGVGLCCVSVCVSVTTITEKIVDGFVPNLTGRFLGGKGRSVEGCGSNGQKIGKPAIVYTLYF